MPVDIKKEQERFQSWYRLYYDGEDIEWIETPNNMPYITDGILDEVWTAWVASLEYERD